MSAEVLAAVLVAALLHATWNAIVKAGSEKTYGAVLVSIGCTAIAGVSLPFLPVPSPESWPYIAASTALQVVYYLVLSAAYKAGDMSQTYPLMRGTAPLVVALAAWPLAGERLSPTEWAGLVMISSGVLAMAFASGAPGNARAAAIALANAGVIATYTLVDGIGVRLSGSPAAYTMWILMLPSLPLVALMLRTREGAAAFRAFARGRMLLGFLGGAASLASYGLVLWAMTEAPVAVIAALRETAIVFATVISVFILKERVTGGRILATAVIAAGAAVLRLA